MLFRFGFVPAFLPRYGQSYVVLCAPCSPEHLLEQLGPQSAAFWARGESPKLREIWARLDSSLRALLCSSAFRPSSLILGPAVRDVIIRFRNSRGFSEEMQPTETSFSAPTEDAKKAPTWSMERLVLRQTASKQVDRPPAAGLPLRNRQKTSDPPAM